MQKVLKHISFLLAAAFVCFHLYTGVFGVIAGIGQKTIHLVLILTLYYLSFIMKPDRKIILKIFDVFMILCAIAGTAYIMIIDPTYDLRAGVIYTRDIVFGLLLILSLVVAGRRALGWPLTIVVGCFVLYGFCGPFLPGLLKHSGISLGRMIHLTVLTTEGVFGSPLYAASAYIILFVILGAVFTQTGVGDYFTGLSTALLGRFKGGPAKVAVLASGLFGSISGSAIANVVGTGTFTIPLMKKCGFDDEFAGAVEASASTGGQIMPPIMGTTAFLAAEMLGIPYMEFAKAAVIPAVLYFVAILFSVDLYARKKKLGGTNKEDMPKREYVIKKFYLLIPLFFLIYVMVGLNFSISKTAIWTIICTIIISFLSKDSRITWEKTKKIIRESVSSMIPVSIACAMVGIIIAMVMGSGLGYRLSSILIRIASGSIGLLLFLTMVVCIILGMGMPTTAAYLVLAVLVAPALQQMGVPPLASHLFIFYFGIISCVTPPVALAAYAAAGLSGASPTRTGYKAFVLALSGFILPFIFVNNPVMLMEGTIAQISVAVISSLVGIYALSATTQGYLIKWDINIIERIICAVCALCLIDPTIITDLVGYGCLVLLIAYKFITNRKKNTPAPLANG